ncbi:MAG: phosphotransferase family protein [Burkholderiales bacterium]|nr:MAG: phosphotransferase family protein [Burkholderiales bacterium]
METRLLALARRIDPAARSTSRPERLSGGANNETWAFDVVAPSGTLPLILRRKAGDGSGIRAPGDPDDASIAPETEAEVLRSVAAAGVPVPAVRAVLEPADGLGRGFVMERVPGETRPKRLLHDSAFADARRAVLHDCGRALAALHAAPVSALPPLRVTSAAAELALWERRWRAHRGARPVFELALRWLHAHLPATPARPVPLHGDFRTGNLLLDARGLRAVLDWELACVGDPMADLGWFCVASWRFGELDAVAGGFGPLDDLLDAYRAAGGVADAERVRYWEVLGTFRWGVMCLDMAEAWRTGRDRSVERTAVGRRASETELDLLRLLAPRR